MKTEVSRNTRLRNLDWEYAKGMPLEFRESIRNQIYSHPWGEYETRPLSAVKEGNKIRKKFKRFCRTLDILNNPLKIPVLIVKMKGYIRRNCPEYTKYLF